MKRQATDEIDERQTKAQKLTEAQVPSTGAPRDTRKRKETPRDRSGRSAEHREATQDSGQKAQRHIGNDSRGAPFGSANNVLSAPEAVYSGKGKEPETKETQHIEQDRDQRPGQASNQQGSAQQRGGDKPGSDVSVNASAAKSISATEDLLNTLVVSIEQRRHLRRAEVRIDVLTDDQRRGLNYTQFDTQIDDTRRLITMLEERAQSRELRLLSLAATPGMSTRPALKPLPASWWERMQRMQQSQAQSDAIEAKIKEQRTALDGAIAAQEAAQIRRTGILLRRPKDIPFPEEAQNADHDLLEACEQAQSIQREYGEETRRLSKLREGQAIMMTMSLDQAEEALIRGGLIKPSDAPAEPPKTAVTEEGAKKQQGQRRPNSERPDFGRRGQDDHFQDEDRPWTVRDTLREYKQAELCDARKTFSDASREFHAVRDNYGADLARYGQEVDNGERVGTRTDFDIEYFDKRNWCTHQVIVAQEAYRYARKQAEKVGLPDALDMQTSDFADRSDDGYAESELDPRKYLNVDRIERWRNDDGQRTVDALPERPFGKGAVHQASVASPPAMLPDDHDFLAEGRMRKLIDRWEVEREELRLRMIAYRMEHAALAGERFFRAFCGVSGGTESFQEQTRSFKAYCGVALCI